jgi:hypothetical protein
MSELFSAKGQTFLILKTLATLEEFYFYREEKKGGELHLLNQRALSVHSK